jgi:hypothetical protein
MGQLRQAEVQDFRLASNGEEDVRRLDVTMGDPFGVGRVQRIGNLNGQLQDFIDSQGRPLRWAQGRLLGRPGRSKPRPYSARLGSDFSREPLPHAGHLLCVSTT